MTAHGKVIGVKTDRDGGMAFADVVILGEGVNGLVGQRSGLRSELKPDSVALAVKEMHFLPREVIDSRFNLKGNEGVVIEAMGTITAGMTGTGFLYTNQESISVGIGCIVSDFAENGTTPYGLLEAFKNHPSIKPLLANSECKEYAAHLIPEGGYNSIPELYGDGWIVVGDAGQFVNAVHREGSNLAMTTGRIAGETVVWLKRRRDELVEGQSGRIQAPARRHLRHEGPEEIPENSRIPAYQQACVWSLSKACQRGGADLVSRRWRGQTDQGKRDS